MSDEPKRGQEVAGPETIWDHPPFDHYVAEMNRVAEARVARLLEGPWPGVTSLADLPPEQQDPALVRQRETKTVIAAVVDLNRHLYDLACPFGCDAPADFYDSPHAGDCPITIARRLVDAERRA